MKKKAATTVFPETFSNFGSPKDADHPSDRKEPLPRRLCDVKVAHDGTVRWMENFKGFAWTWFLLKPDGQRFVWRIDGGGFVHAEESQWHT